MERIIFPLVETFSPRGTLVDIWPSGMVRIVDMTDPEYFEILHMTQNPPDQKSDEEIWKEYTESGEDESHVNKALSKFERERLESMREALRRDNIEGHEQ